MNRSASHVGLKFIEDIFSAPEVVSAIAENDFPLFDDYEITIASTIFMWHIGCKTLSIGFIGWLGLPTAFFNLKNNQSGCFRHLFPIESAELVNITKIYAREKALIIKTEKNTNE